MANFCKTEECPTSDHLLTFQIGDLPMGDVMKIQRHLDTCEFCSAEVDFYRLYPPVDETVLAPQIPQSLFELAEALLGKKKNESFFAQFSSEEIDQEFDKMTSIKPLNF